MDTKYSGRGQVRHTADAMNEDLELLTRVLRLSLNAPLLDVSVEEKIAALEEILESLREVQKFSEIMELELLART